MDMEQAVEVVKWVGVDFEEHFWFRLKVDGTQGPDVVNLGTPRRSFSSSFQMTVSQDRPVRLELTPLGTIITIYNESRFPAVMEAAG